MVGGQLHDEGGRVAGKGFGLFQDDAADDDGGDADEVSADGHQAAAAEDGAGQQADDGHLGAAGDKAGGHDGQLAVTVLLDGAAGHDAGNAAARGHQQGDEALARQAEPAEDAVHHEGDAGHVADVLQNGQQEAQDQDLGHKAQGRAHAGHDAVVDEAHQPVGAADGHQEAFHGGGHDLGEQHVVDPVGAHGAEGDGGAAHGDGVHRQHDDGKDGQGEHPVGDDPVDPVGDGQVVLAGLAGAGLLGDGLDKGVALGGDDAFGVVVQLLFAGGHGLLHLLGQGGVQPQGLHHLFVPLKQLDGVPAQEAVLHLAAQQPLDGLDGLLHAAGEHPGQADGLAGLGGRHGGAGGGGAAVPLQGAHLHGLAAHGGPQLVQVDPVAVLAHQVDHVHGDHHRDAQLDQLGGQVEVALDVGAVHDVQDDVGLFAHQVAAGHHFFQGVGRQGINARQVLHDDVLVVLQAAVLFLDGDAGPVAHILIGAGQGVEQGGLAAVRVACQCDLDLCHVQLLLSHPAGGQLISTISASALRTLSS